MTWCRTSCGRWWSRCCRRRLARRTAAGTAPSQIATASPRSCSWPAPLPRGGYCPPVSSAAVRRRHAGAASPSGRRLGCSTPCISRSWTGWASRAGWTGIQAVLDDVPPIRTPSGRRRTRPGKVHADKAYDSGANRAYLRRRGIRPRIARRGVESSVRLGRHRWRIERALAWRSCFRRLQGCGGTATRAGGLRSCCWPVRSSASTGSNRPQRRHDVLRQRSFAGRAPAARNVGGN
jgi:hypothetical protein